MSRVDVTRGKEQENRRTPWMFLGDAERYLRAAECLVPEWRSPFDGKRDPFMETYPVCDYLAGRAIELGLKAFLLGCGTDIETLKRRPFSHDLVALKEEAVKQEFEKYVELTSADHAVIGLLAGPYANKELEYPGEGSPLKSPLERGAMLGTVDRLVRSRGLGDFCRKATLRIVGERRSAAAPQEGKS